ncbi:MAG: M2 family metallopeptidase [Pirellulales bacterium]|nr:M2 family metallopeptidase [Pirellulales bacterium]
MRSRRFCACLFASLLVWNTTHRRVRADEETMTEAQAFIRSYEETVKPLQTASGRAWWDASTTGRDEDFAAKEVVENRLNELLSSPEQFQRLQKIRRGGIKDAYIARQIELLHWTYLEKQVDLSVLNRIASKENTIEKTFNKYRAKIGERSYTSSQVREVLLKSKDTALRQKVWEASKDVGAKVASDLRELVILRNRAAHQLGFADFHAMRLELNEQNQAQVLQLFDQLDQLTRKPFAEAKEKIDRVLAAQYGIAVNDLRPWHYHDLFFQEPPGIYDVDIDGPFATSDILGICKAFYQGIGLPVDDVIERSDLYEKPKKSPHAFCIDIDRSGDVRVLANIKPTEYWMSTMLHELGHAVYSSKYIPSELPYLLRSDAHILATEGVAMMFERFSTSGEWLNQFGVEVPDPAGFTAAGRRMRRDKLLIFSRWCQVMLRFEVALYQDPDQDLNTLWWDLVERYQLLTRPEGRSAPDYASKIHVVTTPAYYHNYMMGELFACQLHAAIVRALDISTDPATAIYKDNLAVGEFMKRKVFGPGLTLPWDELIRQATGEELNAMAFAEEFSD